MYKSTPPLSTKKSANLSSVATLNILFICKLYIPVRFSEQEADEQKVVKLLKINFEKLQVFVTIDFILCKQRLIAIKCPWRLSCNQILIKLTKGHN